MRLSNETARLAQSSDDAIHPRVEKICLVAVMPAIKSVPEAVICVT